MIKLPIRIIINEELIDISWTDSETRQIELFFDYAKKLNVMLNRKYNDFINSLSYSKKLNNKKLITKIKLPSDDDKSILLHNLRPFILNKEFTFLPNIINLLNKKINSKVFRTYTKNQKDFFLIKRNIQPIVLTVNEECIINSDETLRIWLNAYEYHREEKKIDEIKKITNLISFDEFEFFMINSLLDKCSSIQNIQQVISSFINKKEVKLSIK